MRTSLYGYVKRWLLDDKAVDPENDSSFASETTYCRTGGGPVARRISVARGTEIVTERLIELRGVVCSLCGAFGERCRGPYGSTEGGFGGTTATPPTDLYCEIGGIEIEDPENTHRYAFSSAVCGACQRNHTLADLIAKIRSRGAVGT